MKLKKLYFLLTCVYSLFTIYEVIMYLIGYSNYFGLFYIMFNLVILFLLIMVSINVKSSNTMIRLSKNGIIVFIGFMSCFVLKNILSSVFGYVDNSNEYIRSISLSINIVKPFIYVVLCFISYLEYKNMKI